MNGAPGIFYGMPRLKLTRITKVNNIDTYWWKRNEAGSPCNIEISLLTTREGVSRLCCSCKFEMKLAEQELQKD